MYVYCQVLVSLADGVYHAHRNKISFTSAARIGSGLNGFRQGYLVLLVASRVRFSSLKGIKARADKVEEHHCLMAANMLMEAYRAEPGWTWNKTSLDNAVATLNEKVSANPKAQITAWKMRALANIMLFMPASIYERIQKHYIEYTWEMSFLTEELLQDGAPREGICRPAMGRCSGTLTASQLADKVSG